MVGNSKENSKKKNKYLQILINPLNTIRDLIITNPHKNSIICGHELKLSGELNIKFRRITTKWYDVSTFNGRRQSKLVRFHASVDKVIG